MEKLKSRYCTIGLLVMLIISSAHGQELFFQRNLADFDVNTLTQHELQRFQRQIAFTNMSEADVVSYLMHKGLPRREITSLLQRMERLESPLAPRTGREDIDLFSPFAERYDPMINRMFLQSNVLPDSLIFGSELFNNAQLDFAPNLQIATPVNYVLGPGDRINLTLYGDQEAITDQTIDPGGRVTVPYAGVVMLGGLTVEQAEQRLRNILITRGFESLATGRTRMTLSVTGYRTIPITVIGARNSGNYLVPSVASAFHALFMAGGPHSRGTYRQIEVIRRGTVIQQIDLYRFLIHGDRSQDVLLEENDVINIPVHANLVRLKGEVKRPGFFELLDGENLDTLLMFAGGFTPIAYRENLYVEQVGTNEFRSRDLLLEEFSDYYPASGDVITVGSILNRFINRVTISGAIMRPGSYGWDEGMMLSNLITRAGGMEESVLLSRGLIYRSSRFHTNEYIRFVPQMIKDGSADVPLMDGDSVVLADRRTMFPFEFIQVAGEVNNPNRFKHGEGMTALDAILLAGGMKLTASVNRIEIARRVVGSNDATIAAVIEAQTDAELIIRADEQQLQPHDIVIVRPNPELREHLLVKIEGEITYPGAYVLLTKGEKLSSVIKRAGGLTAQGDPNAVLIIRETVNPFIQRELQEARVEGNELPYYDTITGQYFIREMLTGALIPDTVPASFRKRQNLNLTGATSIDQFTRQQGPMPRTSQFDTISVNNLLSILNRPGGEYDLHLQNNDRLLVLARNNTVRVKGMVNNDVTVNFTNSRLRTYLDEAGGLKRDSHKQGIFVIEPNGRSRMTRSFIGIRQYPRVVPGSVVVVPPEPLDEMRRDPAQMAAVASILTSAAGLVIMISSLVR